MFRDKGCNGRGIGGSDIGNVTADIKIMDLYMITLNYCLNDNKRGVCSIKGATIIMKPGIGRSFITAVR